MACLLNKSDMAPPSVYPFRHLINGAFLLLSVGEGKFFMMLKPCWKSIASDDSTIREHLMTGVIWRKDYSGPELN